MWTNSRDFLKQFIFGNLLAIVETGTCLPISLSEKVKVEGLLSPLT
jgi:hypothetical protein